MKYSEILEANKNFSKNFNTKKYDIGILSNITINSIKDVLEYYCNKNNISPSIEIGNFDNIVQDSFLYKEKDVLIIFFDTLGIFNNIEYIFETVDDDFYHSLLSKIFNELDLIFKNLINTPSVIINSFSSSAYVSSTFKLSKIEKFTNEINSYLKQNAPKNFHIANIDKIFISSGIEKLVDFRFYHSSKAPYTLEFLIKYVKEIEYILLKNNGKLKKAIILDCDNTLWKGILGEDGIENIDMNPTSKIGKYFNQIQRIMVYLSKRGVLIGLCSKNNEDDVLEVLRKHPNIFLKEENIVISKINWNNKASNLIDISNELNIGLDSMVFIDDSNFEINLIKEQLPEITSIQVPSNLYLYPNLILKNVFNLFNLDINELDSKKTIIYKEQILRDQEKSKYNSLDQYLSSLEIEINIEKNNIKYSERLSQLTQKTNQFNLTTKRYTEIQIQNFILNKNYHVYSLSVKDKFGDNGITGLCILNEIKLNNKNILIIDTFLMSCRIIGRNIEFAFLNSILNDFNDSNFDEIQSFYYPTSKNEQVKYFYDKNNFILLNDNIEKKYSFDFKNLEKNSISYIKVNNNP